MTGDWEEEVSFQMAEIRRESYKLRVSSYEWGKVESIHRSHFSVNRGVTLCLEKGNKLSGVVQIFV